ncbi:type II secretion system major pseudopilin GspG [Marinicella sediminis]|uniref:Type II secretion system core protein G n=1 Tax=Marinicella sediminis TaxID=1792834 RepID=A0ABV7JDS5_9GAMM|nr:type II secretion system major pseudopilin GspG [Marinicella sediminis]
MKTTSPSKATLPGLQSGFTLMEVLIVVVIISILAITVVPQFLDAPDQARVSATKADIKNIETALNMYKLDNYQYPSTAQGLQALVQKPSGTPEAKNWKPGGYLQKLSNDQWGNPYQYLNPGNHGAIDVYSLGADGQPGGEGVNADIGNW